MSSSLANARGHGNLGESKDDGRLLAAGRIASLPDPALDIDDDDPDGAPVIIEGEPLRAIFVGPAQSSKADAGGPGGRSSLRRHGKPIGGTRKDAATYAIYAPSMKGIGNDHAGPGLAVPCSFRGLRCRPRKRPAFARRGREWRCRSAQLP